MLSRIKLQGKWYDRIPYDDEGPYFGDCGDCGCKKGEYHEPGCVEEECPACRGFDGNRGHLIACGCFDNNTIVKGCNGEITITKEEMPELIFEKRILKCLSIKEETT